MTVDKLGVKLYDKASAVVAELIANAYDADAEEVTIKLPLGKALATRRGGDIHQAGFTLEVVDDGHGMTPAEANAFYLDIGLDRRGSRGAGAISRNKRRRVLGRKGVGKLAPFGICRRIEVWSAGGDPTPDGYRVAHFVMDYDALVEDESHEPYHPMKGSQDGSWASSPGTRITLSNFNPHRVPDGETFHRQLASRFGLRQPDWSIRVVDLNGEVDPFLVGQLDISLLPESKINVEERPVLVKDEEGNLVEALTVKGWIGYAAQPYKNVEMAGIRIYARGKIAAQTRDFGVKSGFTGEYNIRSYIVGEVSADWLDDDEGDDLIKTDRQDILWDSERGHALQLWGMELLRELGNKAKEPSRRASIAQFIEASNIVAIAKERYNDEEIQAAAVKIAKVFSAGASPENLSDKEYVEQITELCLTVAPHKVLVDSLTDAAGDDALTVESFLSHLVKANVAELASLGQVARLRINTIEKLRGAINARAPELKLQEIIEEAPWLINPQWTAISSNRSFKNVIRDFPRWYDQEYGDDSLEVTTAGFTPTALKTRPDFIMLHFESRLVIVEIKKPGHHIDDAEFDRLLEYRGFLTNFVGNHETLAAHFGDPVEMVLVADGTNFKKNATTTLFRSLKSSRELQHLKWKEFTDGTEKAHDDFLRGIGQ